VNSLLLSDFDFEFSRQTFDRSTEVSNFMKLPSMGAELFHADGRMDMTKQIVAFRNFSRASKTSGTKAVKGNKIFVLC
jgi:hypothetical protein